MVNQEVRAHLSKANAPTAQDMLAKQIVARLREASVRPESLPQDVQKRLESMVGVAVVAHGKALGLSKAEVREPRSSAETPSWVAGLLRAVSSAYAAFSSYLGRPWLSLGLSTAVVALAVVGVVQVGTAFYNDSVTATADLDAAILADDLPPDAYLDPGFVRYLREFKPENDLPQNDGLDDWFKNIPAEGQTSI